MAIETQVAQDSKINCSLHCEEYFKRNIKKSTQGKIGIEYEMILLDKVSGTQLSYHSYNGHSRLFSELVRYGFRPTFENDVLIGLTAGAVRISLEPGGQLEFSGSPLRCISTLVRELDNFLSVLKSICHQLGILVVITGYNPLNNHASTGVVPRRRYQQMIPYLDRAGVMCTEQKLTTSMQFSLDYFSEIHAGKTLQLALRLQPLIIAIFGNSPIVGNALSNWKSYRTFTWANFIKSRSGIPKFMLSSEFLSNPFSQYTEWALTQPMLYLLREGQAHDVRGITFKRFLNNGFENAEPMDSDWVLHLGTLYPEARLKNVIEMRSADTCHSSQAAALAAFWKGLVYSDESLDEALEQLSSIGHDELQEMYRSAGKIGLDSTIKGKCFTHTAITMIEIARRGLQSQSAREAELSYLDTMEKIIRKRQSPADLVIRSFLEKGDALSSVLCL